MEQIDTDKIDREMEEMEELMPTSEDIIHLPSPAPPKKTWDTQRNALRMIQSLRPPPYTNFGLEEFESLEEFEAWLLGGGKSLH